MEVNTLRALVTVVSFATFIGIVWWAYSTERQRANREAANLPFALPDESAPSQLGGTQP